ncbi:MAG: hypothetical protein KAI47_23725 [Deltaproteobacteria bacterium]|nr:hypothetical protein [Deltaproteobacteria bacterium]
MPTWASPGRDTPRREVTRDGLFSLTPSRYQRQALPLTLRLLADPLEARRLLRGARFAATGGHHQVHAMLRHGPTSPALMFRIGMLTSDGVAFEAFFKPRQRGYDDWATEIAACRLARALAVTIAPCAEREVPRAVLADALARVPAATRARLRWSSGGRSIFGFFRLWAPTYRGGLGRRRATASLLGQLASVLRVVNRSRVLASPLHQALSDLFVLDFLLYNNDRRRNLGVLRDGDRLHLYPIDFGDGLTATPKKKRLCRRLLLGTGLFRRRLLLRLHGLDCAGVRRLLTHGRFGLLVPERQLVLLMRQRRVLLGHIAWVVKRYGDRTLF